MRYFHYCRKSTDDDEHQILSLESQERENLRRFESQPDIEIIEKIEESQSAKHPGRPLFNAMLDRIERGEADGVIAWDPDRIARNSIDGGRVIYLLDIGTLKDLKFSTYTFENSPQGKYMLQMMFANAKYHVDALSVHIKRGNRTKAENGWWPHAAPVGYRNGHDEEPPIVADAERFALVKRLFEEMLTGTVTVPRLREMARRWGLTTRRRKRRGGKPLSISGLYRVLTNPFYAGVLEWEGRVMPGKHEPMITVEQSNAVRRMLGRKDAPRPKRHAWAYTGLLRCACGLAITASHATNRFGTRYTYYHCTRRRGASYCGEPYVAVSRLEEQLANFVDGLIINPALHAWLLEYIEHTSSDNRAALEAKRAALQTRQAENERAQRNLRQLRTRDQISDVEFREDRATLDRERIAIDQELAPVIDKPFEPEKSFAIFSIYAAEWFRRGDDATRRLIVKTAGVNPLLRGGELKIDARLPFRKRQNSAAIPDLCCWVNDVRTLCDESRLRELCAAVETLLQWDAEQKAA